MTEREQEEPQDCKEEDKEELLIEAVRFTNQLAKNLPSEVTRESVSDTSKTAWKAYAIRASLFHRMTELAEVAIDLSRQDRQVAALVITRAAFETAALMYFTYKHIERVVETRELGDIDNILMKVLMGDRLQNTDIESFNSLTAIDKLDKIAPGIRGLYDGLCEFTHPNWSGAMGAYAKIGEDFFDLKFDQKNENIPAGLELTPLITALDTFEHSNRKLSDILPAFTKIHEEGYAGNGD